MMPDLDKIDPTLPHYEVRKFLAMHEYGPEYDARFAELVGLPVGPAYSTDLNAVVPAINALGWWWHISHLEAVVTPTSPVKGMEGLLSNGAVYNREGRAVSFRAGFARENPAGRLCDAWVMAVYDLPAGFYVVGSAKQEALAKVPWSRESMMAYYEAREDHRQDAIARFAKEHPELSNKDSN